MCEALGYQVQALHDEMAGTVKKNKLKKAKNFNMWLPDMSLKKQPTSGSTVPKAH